MSKPTPASALSAFAKKEPAKKVTTLTLDEVELHKQVLEYAKAKKAMDEAEAALKKFKPELRDAALALYADHNVATSVFAGNVALQSPFADLRVNFNNGYRSALTNEAIADAEAAIGKPLKQLFTTATTTLVDFDKLPKELRAKFEEEFLHLFEKYDAVGAVTLKSVNTVVEDFNQKVLKVLTADEIVVLDQSLPIPATFTVTRLESPEFITAALLKLQQGAQA